MTEQNLGFFFTSTSEKSAKLFTRQLGLAYVVKCMLYNPVHSYQMHAECGCIEFCGRIARQSFLANNSADFLTGKKKNKNFFL